MHLLLIKMLLLPTVVEPHRLPTAYVSIRQHTSADVSIRQHTSAYVSRRQHTSAYVSIRQHTSAYVSIRQHTSAFVSIRQHTSASWSSCAKSLNPIVCPLCQYLYFCTSKASTFVPVKQVNKLSTCPPSQNSIRSKMCQYLYFCTSKASTFVPVKQVNWAPARPHKTRFAAKCRRSAKKKKATAPLRQSNCV
jgi:hypothetical protein